MKTLEMLIINNYQTYFVLEISRALKYYGCWKEQTEYLKNEISSRTKQGTEIPSYWKLHFQIPPLMFEKGECFTMLLKSLSCHLVYPSISLSRVKAVRTND